jgi:2-polyprenyl-3-methyl-5-hydroxy-6-metoxy-1,4-benzoquinol methylase
MSIIRRALNRLEAFASNGRGAARADMSRQADALRSELSQLHKSVTTELRDLRKELRAVQREVRDRLLQYNYQLGRLARTAGSDETAPRPRLSSHIVPLELDSSEPLAWDSIGEGLEHPDPDGLQWIVLDACPVCGHGEHTLVNPWNKLLLLGKAPDAGSARYDYAICHACGVLSAMRRPTGRRYTFLLESFGEVTAKRGGGREIPNRVLNPYPLTEDDRAELKELASAGVFVSDHDKSRSKRHLAGLMRDRFENSGHADLLASLLDLRGARVLEVRSRTGAILDSIRRCWNASVYAMPIWESQQFLLQEVYGISTSSLIDFERFTIPWEDKFDLIVCQHMFTHVLRPQEFFAELRRRLKPGGHIYLHNEPDDREFLSGGQSMIATLNPLHMQAFDQRSLMRALAANGFETVFVKARELTHVCLARVSPEAQLQPMPPKDLARRVDAYQRAYDRAIIKIDERLRGRVASEWESAVARAVASGAAEFDEQGRLRVVAPRD